MCFLFEPFHKSSGCMCCFRSGNTSNNIWLWKTYRFLEMLRNRSWEVQWGESLVRWNYLHLWEISDQRRYFPVTLQFSTSERFAAHNHLQYSGIVGWTGDNFLHVTILQVSGAKASGSFKSLLEYTHGDNAGYTNILWYLEPLSRTIHFKERFKAKFRLCNKKGE